MSVPNNTALMESPARTGDDSEFLALIRESQIKNWKGPAAEKLLGEELRRRLGGLRAEFQEIAMDDLVTAAWEHLRGPAILEKASPWAWLATCVRNYLRRQIESDRNFVAPNEVQSGRWRNAKDELGITGSKPRVQRIDQEQLALLPAAPADVESLRCDRLWESLGTILEEECSWPRPTSQNVLARLQEIGDNESLFAEAITEEFGWLDPTVLTGLTRLVTARRGFMWMILHGHEPQGIMMLPAVRSAVAAALWPDLANSR
ncbi:hypothetical protein ACFRJ9_21695 [Paenarthrobacter sp. NPDC056912]|uniref:hypothetical protein n=1 Tax=Paenarthrobacter sp. NPDC056912 TaxID=3345965 RepID=UPI00366FE78F